MARLKRLIRSTPFAENSGNFLAARVTCQVLLVPPALLEGAQSWLATQRQPRRISRDMTYSTNNKPSRGFASTSFGQSDARGSQKVQP
jgi:hypothetical protein